MGQVKGVLALYLPLSRLFAASGYQVRSFESAERSTPGTFTESDRDA